MGAGAGAGFFRAIKMPHRHRHKTRESQVREVRAAGRGLCAVDLHKSCINARTALFKCLVGLPRTRGPKVLLLSHDEERPGVVLRFGVPACVRAVAVRKRLGFPAPAKRHGLAIL